MDQCTHDVRSEYWKNIILTCQQRPSGQSAKQWMNEHGISEQQYYYWQRKFRKETFEKMNQSTQALPAVQNKSEISFVELPFAGNSENSAADSASALPVQTPVAVIRTGDLSIAFNNDISENLLIRILQEVSHA